MTTNDTYLAVFLGSKTSLRKEAWMALPEAERFGHGRSLGKTKKITERGIEDVSNEMGAFMVVRVESHEVAARLFANHPHSMIFPGESVKIMPVLPISTI